MTRIYFVEKYAIAWDATLFEKDAQARDATLFWIRAPSSALRDTPTLYNLLTWHNSHRAPWRWPSVCSTDRRCTEISEIEITTATIDQECELKTVLRFEDSNLGSQICESISRNSKMLIRILLFSKWLDESKLGIQNTYRYVASNTFPTNVHGGYT